MDAILFQSLIGMVIFSIWGSFMAAAHYRLMRRYDEKNPEHLSLWLGRSQCTSCHKKLAWHELIPVFSWALLKGKCASCGSKISCTYPLIELSSILLFVLHFWYLGNFGHACLVTFVATTLVIMSMIDLKYFILPDDLQLVLFVIWLFSLVFVPHPFEDFLFGLAGLASMLLILLSLRAYFLHVRKKDAIGMGDIKLSGIAGLMIGIWFVPWMLLIASLGTLIYISLRALIKKDVSLMARFPFGPGLALGFYVTLLIKLSIN